MMSDVAMARGLSVLGGIVAALALYLPLAWWKAWVFLTLWGWFVFPVYAIAAPPLWNVAGMFLMVGLVMLRYTKEKHGAIEAIFFSAIAPAFILFFGWVTTFML